MSPATVNLRVALGKTMRATLADEAENHNWTYVPVRPCGMPTRTRKIALGKPTKGDCAKGVQFLCWFVPGVPDPMRQDWDAFGNSQTLWLRLQHLDSVRDLEVGDVVTFGIDGEEHAAMVLETATAKNGWDPLVWSFGHQGAPNTYRLSQDRRPQQYLRNPIPEYVPTPLERAASRTGWFAWVAWRLGEGDYQAYGRASAVARPNVPKVVPLSWWKRYAKYLARRKRPTPASVPIA